LVPSFKEEYVELHSRAEDLGVDVASIDVVHPILVGDVAFSTQRVGAIGS
jgi:hypothetical protein